MAIDELTDEAFFDLYQKNPQIKGIVDSIQKKYHTHSSQKGQPEYNPVNKDWIQEAKGTVAELLAQQQNQGRKEKLGNATSSGVNAGRLKYAAGLILIFVSVAALASGVPYVLPPAY